MSTAGLRSSDEYTTTTTTSPPPPPATAVEAEALRRQFSRTPRPYFHDGQEVLQDGQQSRLDPDADARSVRPAENALKHGDDGSNALSADKSEKQWTQRNGPASTAISESGSEADDERPSFVKALPPASVRLRKGLKTGEKDEDALLMPSQLDDEGRRLPDVSYDRYAQEKKISKEEEEAEREMLQRRRFAEFLRRSSEVALMAVIMLCVLCGRGVLRTAWQWRLELLSHVLTITTLILAYPVKLSVVDQHARPEKLWQRFRVPASFDPATVLYPPLLPVLVALSVAPNNESVVLPNMVLGLSSLPQRLFPRSSRLGGINAVQWLVSVIPLIVSENSLWFSKATVSLPYVLKSGSPHGLSVETLVSLYPLHQALLVPLYHLTTTSLLISELHLLSVALINLLLLAASPQIMILKACLWIGGVTLLVFCGPVLRWNLTLARVPRWKLRRSGHPAGERKSFVDAVTDLINLQRATSAFRPTSDGADSDADEDEPVTSMKTKPNGIARLNTDGMVSPLFNLSSFAPQSAVEPRQHPPDQILDETSTLKRPRRNTLPERQSTHVPGRQASPRKKARAHHVQWYLQLTPDQALRRKWLYAGFTYVTIVVIILGPVREYIARKALHQNEPIGWALGYLFGQIPLLRASTEFLALQNWIPLPEPADEWLNLTMRVPLQVDTVRGILGMANVRLLLVAYWALVLIVGLLAVFSLTAFVEVDTRRKVFHGVMVAMLLPAIFVDPCYCALALALVLAVFLLLEAIRAGQVPPLGSAIGRFVAPYVDGRDLRGPVVVSHIFLLIGCAVPLWFSLASINRSGGFPWVDWELESGTREVAMIAGVVCVGMGDAAASLIGRRYGRHKWLWVGGKSLEGSAAFAAAVTLGLMAAKAWLLFGGWTDGGRPLAGSSYGVIVLECLYALAKAIFCACGASFMEAVLTGANDNVVVPVALWLLVKGVRL